MSTSTSLTEKRRFWQQHALQAQQHNGSLADYAKQHELNVNTLYYWVGVFKHNSPPKINRVEPVRFSAVQIAAQPFRSDVILHLSSQLTLQCSALPDPQWLATLCRQLDIPA